MLFISALTCATAQNLLINGSFELPVVGSTGWLVPSCSTEIPGWRVGCTGNIEVVPSCWLWLASDGLNSLDLNGVLPGSVAQDIIVAAGSTYRVSFDMAYNSQVPAYTNTASLRVTIGDDSHTCSRPVSSEPFWQRKSFLFTPKTSGTVTLMFEDTTGAYERGAALDCVSVELAYICSLATNGRLTFNNVCTNALYTIEWASGINTVTNGGDCWLWEADAHDSWDSLKNFVVTDPTNTVEVPMFYRVKCLPNLFMPTPIGRQFIYGVTNTDGARYTNQITSVGCLKLTSDKEYSIIEMLDGGDCSLRLLPVRSTTTNVYVIPFDVSKTEVLQWCNGPAGTTWTNSYCDGSSDQLTIVTNELITVPAGSFDCLKIVTREINNNMRLRWISWICPGFGMVAQIDFGNGTEPANYIGLVSWADKPRR
jgi:hypothetical protein